MPGDAPASECCLELCCTIPSKSVPSAGCPASGFGSAMYDKWARGFNEENLLFNFLLLNNYTCFIKLKEGIKRISHRSKS